MGHRHSPEEFRGEDAAARIGGGLFAPVEAPVKVLPDSCEQAPPSEGSRSTTGVNFVSATQNHSWGVHAALFALDCYKSYLSVWFAGTCRFEPTCSRYASEAIERFGVARGMYLGTKRLLRCHPLSGKFGHEPVPEKWKEMPEDSSMTSKIREVRP
jgi:uncharacterized protein